MKTLIRFELQKIFAKSVAKVAITALLFLSVFLSFATYRNMYAYDGDRREGTGRQAVEIDKSVAEKYAGVLTVEKVRQMMLDFKPEQDLHGLNPAYLYWNATQSALFARFSDPDCNWNGLSVSDVFGDAEIKIGYTLGWLRTSQNLVKVFIVLSIVIAVMLAPVFAGEYGGPVQIILTCKYGKTKCVTAKIIAGLTASLSLTAIVSAINLVYAFTLYGGEGLDCSILFTPMEFVEGYIPFSLTCGTLLFYQILLAFTGSVCVTGITFAFSAVCKNQMTALAASAAIYLCPVLLPVSETSALFKIVSLLPLYHAQFVSLMSVAQSGDGLLYALLAVPTAFAILGIGGVAAHCFFVKHQVL